MDGRFGKYSDAKRKGLIRKNRLREKNMFKTYARSARTSKLHMKLQKSNKVAIKCNSYRLTYLFMDVPVVGKSMGTIFEGVRDSTSS
jgi:hypothetical protein